MKSILNESSTSNQERSLNFIVVGCGNLDAAKAMTFYLQKVFASRLSKQNVTLYDFRTIEKAEFNRDLLRKSNKLLFRHTKDHYENAFYGYFGYNYDEIQKLWYDFRETQSSIPQTVYYSKNALFQLIHAKYNDEAAINTGILGDVLDTSPCDFRVNYHYQKIDDDTAYIRVDYSINGTCFNGDEEEHIQWFNMIITELDFQFSECFKSAYISYEYYEFSIFHEALYNKYSLNHLNQYILGAEWSVYISNKIADNFMCFPNELKNDIQFCFLENGMKYQATTTVQTFTFALRNKIEKALEAFIIPAYGIYGWSQLYQQSHTICYPPETISVYCDDFSVNDPTVIFSYKLQSNQVYALEEIQDESLLGHWRKY